VVSVFETVKYKVDLKTKGIFAMRAMEKLASEDVFSRPCPFCYWTMSSLTFATPPPTIPSDSAAA
jgi:hypothetical protein